MKKLTLIRSYLPDRTIGFINSGLDNYVSLELPDRDNQINVSCIPEGLYLVEPDSTGRHKFYRFNNVTGRTDIEMHPASDVQHLLGCIGLGVCFTAKYTLMESEQAMHKFVKDLGNEPFLLQIRSFVIGEDSWPDI